MKRIALLAIVAMITTACLAPPPDLGELDTGAQSESTTTTADTTVEVEEETSDHHDDDTADHEHEGDEPADHHDDGDATEGDDSSDGSDAAQGEARRIDVVVTEFAFDPSSFTVTTGETVQFFIRNEGQEEHEFRVTTMHAAEEHVASGHEGHDDDGEGGHGHEEGLIIIPAGQSRLFSMTFEHAGEFDLVTCLIPGHFENGMMAELSYES